MDLSGNAPPGSALMARLGDVVLGQDPRMRLRLMRTLISSFVYALCIGGQAWAAAQGLVSPSAALLFGAAMGAGNFGFYLLIRSGASTEWRDPAVSLPQSVFAIGSVAIAYSLNPEVRGMVMSIGAFVLMYAAFSLSPRRCQLLGWITAGVLGLTMWVNATLDPVHFPPSVELLHFVFALFLLPTFGVVSGELARLRIDLQRQRSALRVALARLKTVATRDELTGLPNRRYLLERITQETLRTRRSGGSIGVALIDLDHFKRVNDTHGHAAGDAVLVRFASVAACCLRESDIVARWGGEEFLVAMPDSTLADVDAAMRRLREALADPKVWIDCPGGPVTFSAGVTEHAGPERFEHAVDRADGALYDAKTAGRDRAMQRPRSPAAGAGPAPAAVEADDAAPAASAGLGPLANADSPRPAIG